MAICSRCAGSRRVRDSAYTWAPCHVCGGTGERATPPEDRETPKVLVLCPACKGDGTTAPYLSRHTGVSYIRKCELCDGHGETHPALALDWSNGHR